MKSRATPRFWKLYGELPSHVRWLARKNYLLWQENHEHPSLSFKKLKGGSGGRFSVRIGDHYRAIGQRLPVMLSNGSGSVRTKITSTCAGEGVTGSGRLEFCVG